MATMTQTQQQFQTMSAGQQQFYQQSGYQRPGYQQSGYQQSSYQQSGYQPAPYQQMVYQPTPVGTYPSERPKPNQSWWDYFTGKEQPKNAAEMRVDRYVNIMMHMDSVFKMWEVRGIDKHQAYQNAKACIEQITDMGTVDGELARTALLKKGIDDQRRLDLEREFRELEMACGVSQASYSKPGTTSTSINRSAQHWEPRTKMHRHWWECGGCC